MRNSQLSDQDLVRQYIDGSDQAFEVFLRRHKSQVFTKILYMVKDREAAEDIFQDTFIKAIQTLKNGRYNEEGKFLPWIMRIAHNLVIDYFRKGKKMPAVRSDDDHDVFATISHEDMNVEEKTIFDQVMLDVRKLIDCLPSEQREVVIMRHYYNMSFKEIADSCDVSINTALGRMRYALINMRKMVEQKEIVLSLS
jgi:RNA polymerase sigma-70 factor (ECF subfamily)